MLQVILRHRRLVLYHQGDDETFLKFKIYFKYIFGGKTCALYFWKVEHIECARDVAGLLELVLLLEQAADLLNKLGAVAAVKLAAPEFCTFFFV